MKRILILIKGLGRGGAEQLLASAAPHLDRSRFTYEVAYLLPRYSALVPELESAGLPVRCLEGTRGAGWIGRLRALVRERRIDLVHAHTPFAAVGARIGLTQDSPLMVTTEHNVWGSYHRATYWANIVTFHRNDYVFAVSDQVRRSLRYPGGLRFLPMPKMETLYQGIDLDALQRTVPDGVREELGIPDDSPIVGTIASFKAQKGHRFLLQAACQVRQAIPNVRFVLVGEGPLEQEVREEARRLGLDGTVIFTGGREDALRLAASFDVFVLSSLYEGLSVALLECMALGKPAVVTGAGGLAEALQHGKQGLVVEPGDAESLAVGIVRLLSEESLRTTMGVAARHRARDFDIRGTVLRVEAVYEELLR